MHRKNRGFVSGAVADLDHGRGRRWIAMVGLAVLVAIFAACSAVDETADSASALAQSQRWTLPSDVLTTGGAVRLTYDGAPLWTGTRACSGRLKTGSRLLGEYLLDQYAVVTSVGGYACRRNTADRSRMSVHGTGRALDIFIPKKDGTADNARGDRLANWLVSNAARIGVQLIIWDRTVWRANGTNDARYTGPHPHDDHIHVELTNAGGAASTMWFKDVQGSSEAGTSSDATAPRNDAGGSTRADASTADAGSDPGDPGDPGEPEPEPSEPDAASDGGASEPPGESSDEAPPNSETGWETPEGESGEADSLGPSTSNRRRPAVTEDDEPAASSGCSAVPSRASLAVSGLDRAALGSAVALGIGIVLRRRRKR